MGWVGRGGLGGERWAGGERGLLRAGLEWWVVLHLLDGEEKKPS